MVLLSFTSEKLFKFTTIKFKIYMTFPLENQALVRSLYGLFMLWMFTLILPFSRIYFTSEKFGGCFHSTPLIDKWMTVRNYKLLMFVWMGAVLMIALGIQTILFALINLILCHSFFVRFRWKSPARGIGAPGYMSFWLAAYTFLSEYSLYFGDSEGRLFSLVVFAFQFDFAVMMIDAGINKIAHGYSLTGWNGFWNG